METVDGTAVVPVEEGELIIEQAGGGGGATATGGEEGGREEEEQDRRLTTHQGLEKLERARGWVLGGGPGVSIGEVCHMFSFG